MPFYLPVVDFNYPITIAILSQNRSAFLKFDFVRFDSEFRYTIKSATVTEIFDQPFDVQENLSLKELF